jgi:hypothetical protein
MTDESAFLATLTDHAKAGNDDAYFVLLGLWADDLEEQGDPKAAGVRWMFDNGKRPVKSVTGDYDHAGIASWDWWDGDYLGDDDKDSLQPKFLAAMTGESYRDPSGGNYIEFHGFAAALAAFCMAYLAVQSAADELRRVREERSQMPPHWGWRGPGYEALSDSDCECDWHLLGRQAASLLAICGEPETEAMHAGF